MIKPSQIKPDEALKALLDGLIVVNTSETDTNIVAIYTQGQKPSTSLPDEFIEVLLNGSPRAKTSDYTMLRGNIALAITCKARSDGTVKSIRVNQMLRQVEELVNGEGSGMYFFTINPTNIYTPSAVDASSGYSTMVLNVQWTAKEINN